MKKTIGVLSERTLRKSRLASGLVIFVFVFMHLTNHILGLASLPAAENGRRLFSFLWRNPIGTLMLYGAFLVHILLTLRSLYIRRSMIMPLGEAAQIILGLALPLLLVQHIVATRIASHFYGYADTYRSVVTSLWITSPEYGLQQAVALLVVWIHGCIGIHFWLRYRTWYRAFTPPLLAGAILLPVLSLLGFVDMGRTLADPLYVVENPAILQLNARFSADPTAQHQLSMINLALHLVFGGSVAVVAAFRAHRRYRERIDQVTIRYQAGEAVHVPRGFSVQEASRIGGIPHYSACGGKGRCSTCRIQILGDYSKFSKPDKLEATTLDRINAGPDVRLACQFRPDQTVTVAPLLVPATSALTADTAQETSPGREREIAVLFCDLRDFTALASQRLPFDTVFLLNRYFALVGRAVEEAGGTLDKFIGDGAMALFGIAVSPEVACRQAIIAAETIEAGIQKLSLELADELQRPLRVAIGIHTGPAVVGTVGYGMTRSLTAVGDTVNVASRLEAVAKEYDAAIVFSQAVAHLAGADVERLIHRDIQVRGRLEPLGIHIVMPETTTRLVKAAP